MSDREFRLKYFGAAFILAAIILLCWLAIYARSHSYPYIFVDDGYYYFVYNPVCGEPGELLGTVQRQTDYNIYPWTGALNKNLDSNILPEGTPVYENLIYPDSVIVHWKEKDRYYTCYLMVDGMATIPGEASRH